MRSPRRATARSDDGFGLLELMIALTVLSVGLFSMLVVFTSAKLSLTRTDKIATAAVIADQQMERFRALEYSAIALNRAEYEAADATYKGDSAYPGENAVTADAVGTCGTLHPSNQWCKATRTVSATSSPPSPDGRSYRVDTYVDKYQPPKVGVYPQAEEQRRVTIVVRDMSTAALPVLARESSVLDAFTGLINANTPTT